MHKLQPKHTKISKEEVDKLLSKLNISLTQLPKISKKDEALEGMEIEKGDVLKVERKGDVDEEYFRVVV